MRSTAVIAIAAAALAGCGSPSPEPQDSNVVNGTLTDQAYPSGAASNDIITGSNSASGVESDMTAGSGADQHPRQP